MKSGGKEDINIFCVVQYYKIKAGNVLKGIVRAMDAYNYLVRTRMIRADLISMSFNATVALKKYVPANSTRV